MRLETTGLYALGIPLIALIFGAEYLLARRRGLDCFSTAETISNLSSGLGTLLLGIFTGPWILALYDAAHAHAPVRLDGTWIRWPIALLLADLCYYLWHRAGHRFAILWAIHGVHHQHERLNTSVGLRLEWLADLGTIFFFAAMPLAGIDSTTGFLAIAFLSLYTLTTHSAVFHRPTFGFLVTPATHGSHHSRDARFAGKNFGAMFAIWDRLLGTHLEPAPGDRLALDVPTISRIHDGVGAQWSLIPELIDTVRDAGTLYALVAPPRMVPPARTPRDESLLDASTRTCASAGFAALVVLATWLLWLRGSHPLALEAGGTLLTIWGLRTIGGLLDGRQGARAEETARLFATLLFALAIARLEPIASALIVAGMLGSAFLLARSTSPRAMATSR